MGATVTTGKKVAALRTASGKIGHVLFEATYEKNCHPHTPRWSCAGLGYIEDVFQIVFRRASSCEGGMLQGTGGAITPEGYIQGWYKSLATPIQMPDLQLSLKFGTCWSGNLLEERKDATREVLQQEGWGNVFTSIESGGYAVSLAADFDLLRVLYGPEKPLGYAWSLIEHSPHLLYPAEGLGYFPVKVKAPEMAIPKLFRVRNNDKILVQQPDGCYRLGGHDYAFVGKFIEDYATRELQYPGSYFSEIKRFRMACKEALSIPDSTIISVSITDAESKWEKMSVEKFASIMGISKCTEQFEVTLADVKACSTAECDALYHATCVGNAAKWLIPDKDVRREETASSMQALQMNVRQVADAIRNIPVQSQMSF